MKKQPAKTCQFPRVLSTAVPFLWLAFWFCLYSYLLMHASASLIDSDMASEELLGRLLSYHPGIFLKDWYYSTELRVFNSQLFFEFFFFFTDSWHTVRVLTSLTLAVLLLLSYLFLAQSLAIRRSTALYSAPLLIAPFSPVYAKYVLVGLYYMPHIILAMLSAALILHVRSAQRKGWPSLLVLAALSFLSGLGGSKDVLTFYVPMVLACLLSERKSGRKPLFSPATFKQGSILIRLFSCYTGRALFALLWSGAGWAVLKLILEKRYHFQHMEDLALEEFSAGRLENMIHGIMDNFAWRSGAPVFSLRGCTSLLGLLLGLLVIRAAFRAVRTGRQPVVLQILLSYWFLSVCVVSVAILLTGLMADDRDRYYLVSMAFLVPAAAVWSDQKTIPGRCQQAVRVIPLLGMLLFAGVGYLDLADQDNTAELRNAAAAVEQAGYSEGFATFWNNNVLTELSYGTLTMTDFELAGAGAFPLDNRYAWLAPASALNHVPRGRFFVILDKTNEYENGWIPQFENSGVLPDDNGNSLQNTPTSLLYDSDHYVVYGYQNYEDLKQTFQESQNKTGEVNP